MLSARELLRRQELSYAQVARLSQRVVQHEEQREDGFETKFTLDGNETLPLLEESTMEEVELQVKYESYVRKQEQIVHRTKRLEEHLIPESIDYGTIPHLRTQARQKLLRTRPRTIGQASRVEGVTPADIAILLVYLEKLRSAPGERTKTLDSVGVERVT